MKFSLVVFVSVYFLSPTQINDNRDVEESSRPGKCTRTQYVCVHVDARLCVRACRRMCVSWSGCETRESCLG